MEGRVLETILVGSRGHPSTCRQIVVLGVSTSFGGEALTIIMMFLLTVSNGRLRTTVREGRTARTDTAVLLLSGSGNSIGKLLVVAFHGLSKWMAKGRAAARVGSSFLCYHDGR